MKKAVALLLALSMALSLFGCGSTGTTSDSAAGTTETTENSTGDAGEEDATTSEVWSDQAGAGEVCGDENGKYTIGVVIHTTTDFLCSKYKAYSDYLGKAYGVRFSYYIIENFADETYLSAIENLCAQGVDAIITTNFSGTAVLQGLKTCEQNGVYLAVGWSQIDESIRYQVFSSEYFVGSSYESDYDAGYEIITSLIDAGSTNIAAIGYEPGITCHDRRWEGMMAAFEDHPEVNKAGEYRGLEFTKAVEDFLAADNTIDGIGITLLGIEYCSEPIKSAGREGEVKIAFCDFSENCQQSLESGETVCAIGGQYVDLAFSFVLLYNALEGTPLDKVEIPVNFIVCKTGDEFADYMTYLHDDGVYAWTTDEIDQLIVSKNSEASSDTLLEMGANYSIEDTIARHGE